MKARTTDSTRRKPTALLGALVATVLLGLALAAPSSALAAPVLSVRSSHYPQRIPSGGHGIYTLVVSNTGDATTSGAITVDVTVPVGLRITKVDFPSFDLGGGSFAPSWTCSLALDGLSARCTYAFGAIAAGAEACVILGRACPLQAVVKVDSGSPVSGSVTPTIRACFDGGLTCPPDFTDPTEVDSPLAFSFASFDGGVFDSLGNDVDQAGARPYTGSANFAFTPGVNGFGQEFPSGSLKDVFVDLPPGLVGNPQAVGTCSAAELANARGTGISALSAACPIPSQVGRFVLLESGNVGTPGNPQISAVPVFNMKTPRGTAALFGFNYQGALIYVSAGIRTGGDYGASTVSRHQPQTLSIAGGRFTVWGVPADPAHDPQRTCGGSGVGCASPDAANPKPFLSLPTSCDGPASTDIEVTSWEGGSDSANFLFPPAGNVGCNALDFRPTLTARPTTNTADSPSGLEVDLGVPQNNTCTTTPTLDCGTATAHLRDTTVVLPEGLNVNPSSANGLGACSPAQVDLRGPDAANCPDNSKLGTVSVDTPLLDHPVPGAVYIATPYDNPFGSLLALYIALDDPETGVIVKLAGKVEPDPVTGQLTSTFENNPQLPFSNFHLDFFGGAGGSLRTPAVCGDYETTSSLTPWSAPDSGPPAEPKDPWQILQGPNGAPCANSNAERSHAPTFDAGSESPIANAYTPFVVNLRRDDATQEFSAVTVSPPPGLVAKLAGTQTCSADALAAAEAKTGKEEQASPSCPAASEVGSVNAAAGAGPAPYNAPGRAYLSGPYKGAPLSMAVITPAVAGPFDLGNVVTKVALYVNSKTAEITAKADPIPHILQGIPLDVRSIAIKMDRPNFTLNPTNCDPMAVNGLLTSTLGQTATLTSRFQLGECAALGFKPNLILSLRGGTRRGKHPALTATLIPRPGDANIKSVSVAFPRSEFLENAHIRTICTRPDFAADNCPAGAIYGSSTVDTPLLDYDLTGNVYLRSSDNLLPDLVPDLRGPAHQPIRIEAAGRTDSIRGGIRNTFDFFPDAPFTKAVVSMQGGSKGLLVNSRDICGRTYRATVKYTAHNGLTYTAHPKLRAQCGRKAKRGGRRSRR